MTLHCVSHQVSRATPTQARTDASLHLFPIETLQEQNILIQVRDQNDMMCRMTIATEPTVPEPADPTDAEGHPTGLHARVLDLLGLAICGGDVASGSVFRIEELEARFGVSRSVVREAIRVLASMGMVESRRRVGIRIQPAAEWNLYDPQIIRWRLASPARIAQLQSLTELRTAIEPEAARLAAVRAPLAGASELMGLAGKLWAAGQSNDAETFLILDSQFHRLVLTSSGNEMCAKLNTLVEEVLTGRTHYGLIPVS